jgi:quinolinate synthase
MCVVSFIKAEAKVKAKAKKIVYPGVANKIVKLLHC